jgi:DNA invertase Pin-like site-specific DNA recombinase
LVHTEVERGRSAGTGKKRPGLDHVRDMIRRGDADTLVVWKLDRCSRSAHDFSVLLEELRESGAGFVSCTESFDTSDPMGEAMVQITMVFAQLERARSSQRAVAWHAHRARRGDPYLGGVPFGYVRARDDAGRPAGPLEIDADTAPLVQQAAAVFLETRSMLAVQRFFDEHGYELAGVALRRGLASPQLAGIRIVDGVKIPGTWPAILEVAMHEAIVAELNKPERGRGRPAGSRWLLSGFTVCGRCGQPMLAGGHRKVKAKGGGTDRSPALLPLRPGAEPHDGVRGDDRRRRLRGVGRGTGAGHRVTGEVAVTPVRSDPPARRRHRLSRPTSPPWRAGTAPAASSRSSGTRPVRCCSTGSPWPTPNPQPTWSTCPT